MTVEDLDIEQFNNLVFEKYNYKGNSILKEKIHYFSCENTTSWFGVARYSSQKHWVCNECNTPNFTQSVPEEEIEL